MSGSKSSAKVAPLDSRSQQQKEHHQQQKRSTTTTKSKRDLLDVYVLCTAGDGGNPKRTSTMTNAGRNHLVTQEQLRGQSVFFPTSELEASSGSLTISLFDEDKYSGDDPIGTYVDRDGDLLHAAKRAANGTIKRRFKLRFGDHDGFAGNVDVSLRFVAGPDEKSNGLWIVFEKFLELRDVDALQDLRGQVDVVPVWAAVGVLVLYYVVGVTFYSQYPMALRDDSPSEDTALFCSGGNVTANTTYTYPLPTDDFLATCDQNQNATVPDCSGFVDGFYFVTATLTTVGYGDMGPGDIGARGFSIFFAFFSTAYVGTALGIISGFLMDRQDALEAELKKRKGKPVEKSETEKKCRQSCKWFFSDSAQSAIKAAVSLVIALVVGMIFYAIELIVGQGNAEHATFVNLLYFATITSTTIGYGDEAPATIAGRVVGSFYMLFAVVSFGVALSALADIPLARRRAKMQNKVVKQFGDTLSQLELQNLIRNANDDPKDDSCDKAEFIISMLVKLDKVRPDQIQSLQETFDKLDADGSGTLSRQDVTVTDEMLLNSGD